MHPKRTRRNLTPHRGVCCFLRFFITIRSLSTSNATLKVVNKRTLDFVYVICLLFQGKCVPPPPVFPPRYDFWHLISVLVIKITRTTRLLNEFVLYLPWFRMYFIELLYIFCKLSLPQNVIKFCVWNTFCHKYDECWSPPYQLLITFLGTSPSSCHYGLYGL